MRRDCVNKYISMNTAKKVTQYQKKLQMQEFERKGKKAKKVHFYEALDKILREVRI